MSLAVGGLLGELARAGLSLAGWVPAATWDAHARAGTRTDNLLSGGAGLLVIGAAGPASWGTFLAELDADASVLTGHAHPFDAFVRRRVEAADRRLGATPRRWLSCAAEDEVHLDFRKLGLLAGLGATSRLGLLLHPEHGPWIALRAACVLAEAPEDLPPVTAPTSPCEACAAAHGELTPCVQACPGGAFPRGTWDVDLCTLAHGEGSACLTTCASRRACPVGAASRYPEDAMAYHYDRLGGRGALRRRVGLPDGADPFEGDGPHWATWRERLLARVQPRT